MKASAILLVVLGLLVAAPAWADEPAAGDLYHEAYVLEVIEGDVPGAARRYLALSENPDVPVDIRAASRLRLAICVVLRGRADEARLQLDDLIRDPATPEATRERARRYLGQIAELAPGSELDRKLQDLVFDLARVDPAANEPPVYRDFEVLGKPTVPFLRQLLQHPDASLVGHAFRLLMRMDEPDLVRDWTPRIGLGGQPLVREWTRGYLPRHPEQWARWEEALRALDADGQLRILETIPGAAEPPFSLAFLESLAADQSTRDLAFRFLPTAGEETERWQLVERWLADETLGDATAAWILDQTEGGPDEAGVLRRWPRVLERTARRAEGWTWTRSLRGSRPWNLLGQLGRLPTSALLDSLATLIDLGDAREEAGMDNPLLNGLAASVTKVLGERELDAAERQRYGALLRRWLTLWRARVDAASGDKGTWRQSLTPLLQDTARFLEEADDEEGKAFITFLFEGPARGRIDEFSGWMYPYDVGAVERLAQAIQVVPEPANQALVGRLPALGAEELSEAMRSALLAALPAIVRHTGPDLLHQHLAGIPSASRHWSVAERRRYFEELLQAVHSRGESALERIGERLLAGGRGQGEAFAEAVNDLVEVRLPVLDATWETLPPKLRDDTLEQAWHLQTGTETWATSGFSGSFEVRDLLTEENRTRLRTFLETHLAETPERSWQGLFESPTLLPLETWVPLAPARIFRRQVPAAWEPLRVSGEVDRVARALTADPSTMSDAVLAFVPWIASDAVQREVFDRMLSSGAAAVRGRAIGRLSRGGTPASPEGLEAARASILDEAEPEVWEARMLAQRLLELRPSADVFPLVRIVLGGENRYDVLAGIEQAKSLGQEALVPDLVPFLDSMDKEIRDAARDAIQAIREVTRMKNESVLREKGLLPR